MKMIIYFVFSTTKSVAMLNRELYYLLLFYESIDNTLYVGNVGGKIRITKIMTDFIDCLVLELQVIENDELPNCICKTCSMKIVRAFEFRQLAKRSNEILRRFVQDKVSILF